MACCIVAAALLAIVGLPMRLIGNKDPLAWRPHRKESP